MAARKKPSARNPSRRSPKVRYAVAGLGYFAQQAILPAFAHADRNSELVALVSDDPDKLRKLGRKYGARIGCGYDRYDELLAGGEIDAVYIALPNDLHADFAVRAARRGVHVLCEKPLALSERECADMIRAADENDVRLMTAYRLHFEAANLKAAEAVRSGTIGDPRCFSSVFSMQVAEGNIRVQSGHGGGPAWDLGVYCINAARMLFGEEPIEVLARTSGGSDGHGASWSAGGMGGGEAANGGADSRFREVEETASAILSFPGGRQAVFSCCYNAYSLSEYTLSGTKGFIRLRNAYDYSVPCYLEINTAGKAKHKEWQVRDQVAPELIYFSACVLGHGEPEPSGREGLADVRVIRALHESARTGRPVGLDPFEKRSRPDGDMAVSLPAAEQEDLFHAASPNRD